MVRTLAIGLLIGLINGTVLALFFKFIQDTTYIKVYTLLLNIDFIPYLNHYTPEMIEFMYHLFVSCGVSIFYGLMIFRFNPYLFNIFFIITPTCLLYFPLSFLAVQEVPAITNITALFIWILGHIMYGILLIYLYDLFKKVV